MAEVRKSPGRDRRRVAAEQP
jgi:hypothetical protein